MVLSYEKQTLLERCVQTLSLVTDLVQYFFSNSTTMHIIKQNQPMYFIHPKILPYKPKIVILSFYLILTTIRFNC